MQQNIVGPSIRGKLYRKFEVLGKGQYGKVFKVVDESNNVYAMKEISIDSSASLKMIQSLKVEQNIMEMINHPRILHLYDKIIQGNGLSLVTTYCDGGDLENLLLKNAKNVGFGEKLARFYLIEIAEAFAEFKKMKIIHRDLKLANIFLKDNHVMIGDFGFAKLGVSFTDSKLGTPYYMAPEILNVQKKMYNSKCDLWSIGVCFYLLLFGVLPFEANTLTELKSKIEMNSGEKLIIPKHQSISFESKNLLMRLLEKHSEKRISFSEFFAACGVLEVQTAQLSTGNTLSHKASKNTLDTRDEEELNEDQGLIQSQMQNLGRMNGVSHQPIVIPHQNMHNNGVDLSKNPVQAIKNDKYKHTATPSDSFDIYSNGSNNKSNFGNYDIRIFKDKFESLVQEVTSGFVYPKGGSFLANLQPYVNEINKAIFNYQVYVHLKICLSPDFPNLNNGELGVTLLIIHIFVTRKIDLKISDLLRCLSARINVFKQDNFEDFANSTIFRDLVGIANEFSSLIANCYQSLYDRFQRDNPKNSTDFALYRELNSSQLEPAIRKLSQKLCESFFNGRQVFYEMERSFFLRSILELLYLSKLIPFPNGLTTPDNWASFIKSLHDLSDNQIQKFIQNSKLI
jgi:serine/threonine protein kinase